LWLSPIRFFAGGERDHEAAAEIIKAWARVRLKIAMQFRQDLHD
jgi:hypothetical protein